MESFNDISTILRNGNPFYAGIHYLPASDPFGSHHLIDRKTAVFQIHDHSQDARELAQSGIQPIEARHAGNAPQFYPTV